MTFTRLQDVFDKIRQAHEEAAKCCREAMQSTDARVRLLADYFRDREVVLTRTLRMLESSKDENLLDTWVQYASLKEMDDALAKLRQIPVQDGSAITNQALVLQNEIISLFEQLASNDLVPPIREVLLQMAEQERAAARELGLAETMQDDA